MLGTSGKRAWVILGLVVALAMISFPLWGRGLADPLFLNVVGVVGFILTVLQVALQLLPAPQPREFKDPLKQLTPADLQKYRHGDKDIRYTNRGATNVDILDKHRRILLSGRLGIGKTTEGVTLAQIAHAMSTVTSLWEPTIGFAKLDDRALRERAREMVHPSERALLWLDDLPRHVAVGGSLEAEELTKLSELIDAPGTSPLPCPVRHRHRPRRVPATRAP